MGALHVVGKDFELRHGIGARARLKQKALEILRCVGLLRMARDLDLAEEIAGRARPVDCAHGLVGGRLGLGMDDLRHEFAGDTGPANRHPAEFEMRTLGQPHFDFHAGVVAPCIGDEERGARALAQRHAEAVEFGRITADDEAARHVLARSNVNHLPLVKRRHAEPRERVHIGIAPRLVAAGRESGCRHAITAS